MAKSEEFLIKRLQKDNRELRKQLAEKPDHKQILQLQQKIVQLQQEKNQAILIREQKIAMLKLYLSESMKVKS